MNFKQPIFYLFFMLFFWCNNVFAYCYSSNSGKYCLTSKTYECPSGCYCLAASEPDGALDKQGNGQKDISSSQVSAWCSNGTSCPWNAGSGQCGTSNNARIYRCPSSYPNSGTGSTASTSCYLKTSAGKYVATVSAGQTSCPAGYKCSGGTTVYYGGSGRTVTGGATICAAGTYSTGSASSCTSLPSGYYGGEGATSSTGSGKVSAGYFNSGGGTTATPSNSAVGGKRGVIAGGYYSNGGGTSDKPTGSGNGCLSGQQCGKVSAGYYSGGGGTSATPTSAGNGCLSGQQCGKCASDATSVAGSSYCSCKEGYSIGGGSSKTTYSTSDPSGSTCARRTYTVKYDLNGGSGTKPANQTCTYGVSCDLASISTTSIYRGGYKLVGWTSAVIPRTTHTASGKYVSEMTFYAVWEQCGSGTYHGTDGVANTCFSCPTAPEGWSAATSNEGSTSWSYCQTKKSIENCDPDTRNVAVKHAISATEWGGTDASAVAPKAGYYKTGSGDAVQCLLCPAGQISQGGQGVTSCTKCEEGQGTNTEHTACVDCSASQYVNAEGYCATCPAEGLVLYEFINDKSLGMCPIKLKVTVCNKDETNVIYTYSETESRYVRKAGFKVVAGERSVVKTGTAQPGEYDTKKDYCEECTDDKYRVKDANGNWVCGYCGGGFCLKNKACVACPAGYKCPFKDGGNLTCAEALICGQDEYADTGAESCSKCATGYSTFFSGPAMKGFDGSCLFRSTNQYGTGCTTSAACKLIPAQFCISSNCKCYGDETKENGASFIQKRDTCKSSFSLGKNVKLGQINKSVVKVKDKKSNDHIN